MIQGDITDQQTFVLGRSWVPYRVFIVIFVLVFLPIVPYMFRTHDLSPLVFWAIIGPLAVVYVWYQRRYRISWQNGSVVQNAAAGPVVTISVDEMERVVQERSDIRTLLSLSRPGRRITIYGRTAPGMKFIDVSLYHFKLNDVRKLMRLIHERRPDLVVPKGWA
jgi:hypothetical protein